MDKIAFDTDKDLIDEVMKRKKEAVHHSAAWREEAREDYAFVAGNQWSDEDKAKLDDELRPFVVFNRIAPVIDAVTGSEIANRQQVRFLPREPGDAGVNEVLSGAAEWVRQECDAEDEESDSFRDVAICGMGWTETRIDVSDDLDGRIVIERVDPLEMYWDSSARKQNLSDARWIIREKQMSKDDIKAIWSDVDLSDLEDSQHDDNIDVIDTKKEGYYTVLQYQRWVLEPVMTFDDPVTRQTVRMPLERYETILQQMPELAQIKAVQQARKVYKQAFIVGNKVLKDGECPVPSSFTFKCITGKRDRNTNTWFGLVRAMKDPQRWANKFFSDTLHAVGSNAIGGLLAETDAFENPQKAEEDWSDPSRIVLLKPGGLTKIKERSATTYPAALDRMMEISVTAIRDTTGINTELLGNRNAEQAGVVEYSRKQAALATLAPLFDSLRRYHKEQGRILLYMIQEYISDGRLIRITGPEGERYVQLAKETETRIYDVIVDEAPTSPNMKERVWSVLANLLPMLVSQGIPVPPEVIDYTPIPSGLAMKWKEMLKPQQEGPSVVEQLAIADKQAEIEETKSKTTLNMAKAQSLGANVQIDAMNARVNAVATQNNILRTQR